MPLRQPRNWYSSMAKSVIQASMSLLIRFIQQCCRSSAHYDESASDHEHDHEADSYDESRHLSRGSSYSSYYYYCSLLRHAARKPDGTTLDYGSVTGGDYPCYGLMRSGYGGDCDNDSVAEECGCGCDACTGAASVPAPGTDGQEEYDADDEGSEEGSE
ncbi:hypothetical protein VTJ49DRAFT_712 [Mycothermus thermophilus]|uniref:Uncharacterized protein n=1 Tax=Humicola insolens TaxID=85995 RepID=A0ABR3VFA0_HUMIN